MAKKCATVKMTDEEWELFTDLYDGAVDGYRNFDNRSEKDAKILDAIRDKLMQFQP